VFHAWGDEPSAGVHARRVARATGNLELAGRYLRAKLYTIALVEAIAARGIPGDWEPIATQRGMFALLGLSLEQVARLREEHAVYLVGRGRINVAGFTSATFGPFADALGAVLAG